MNEHTLTQLRSLGLDGMVRALEEQISSTPASALGFDERLTLLVQREVAWRDERRVERLLKAAKLKVSSAPASMTLIGAPVGHWTARWSQRWPEVTGFAMPRIC